MNKKTLSVLVCTLVVSTMGMLVLNNSNQSSAAGGLSTVVTETGKAPGSCVKVPGGNTDRYFTYNVRSTNNSDQTLQVNTAVFHSNQSGCASYNGDSGVGGEILGGQLVYQPQQVGDLSMRYDTAAYTCGRTQYDASYNVLGSGWSADLPTTYANVFIGVVVDYGVDCSTPVATGTVIITSNIQTAAHYTTGPAQFTVGQGWNGNHTWSNVPAGVYTVRPDQVPGYTMAISPSSGTQTLAANQTIRFDIVYTPVAAPTPTPPVCTTGTIVVNSNSATAAYYVTRSGGTTFGWNGSHTFANEATGTYSIQADNISGYTKSVTPSNGSLTGCGVLSFTIIYTVIPVPPTPTPPVPTPTPNPTPAPTPTLAVCPIGTIAVGFSGTTLVCSPVSTPAPTANPVITNTNTNNPVITNTNNPVFNNNPVVTVNQPAPTQQPYYYQQYQQYYPLPVVYPTPNPILSQQTLNIQKFGRNISRGDNTNLTSVNARAGDTIEFDIIITAPTNSTLYNVVVSDALPVGLTYSVRSSSLNNVQTADGVTYDGINIGTVSASQQATIKFFATVNQGLGAQTLINTASARADNVSLINSQPVSIVIGSVLSGALKVKTGPTENAFALAGFGGLISSALYVVRRKGLGSLINFA